MNDIYQNHHVRIASLEKWGVMVNVMPISNIADISQRNELSRTSMAIWSHILNIKMGGLLEGLNIENCTRGDI